MEKFVIKEINTDYLLNELGNIGFDCDYKYFARNKFEYKNIKIFNLTSAQANIIKQTALSCGADCATNRDVITGRAELSDAVLGGSLAELRAIGEKLKRQPFKLDKLSEQINALLERERNKTKIVGILNLTPDSFSDGGMFIEPDKAINRLLKIIEEGADMVDIGAESTRPYSKPVESEEQIRRLKPIMDFICGEKLEIPVSVDTTSSAVAEFALNNGADYINDVSGFDFDKKMPNVISKNGGNVIIQHSQGLFENMKKEFSYKNLIDDIYFSLKAKIEIAEEKGIKNIIIDPGIGFGKNPSQNIEIIKRINEFYSLGKPVMAGVSRKSFLGVKNEDNTVKDALSLAFSMPLIMSGTDYLRVHNIPLHKKLAESAI